MLGLMPFKKRANKFNYIPRYFNPEKEAREVRRAELHGERSDEADTEYVPCKYIRTQRDARAARRANDDSKGKNKLWLTIAVAGVLLFCSYTVFTKLSSIFTEKAPTKEVVVDEGFDRYAPIVVVPNDYKE